MPTQSRGHGTQECLTQKLAHISQFSYLIVHTPWPVAIQNLGFSGTRAMRIG
jgi:hypothetical protein